MNSVLSEHFTYKKIFKFTISPILMMIFTSLYGIVDGFFISNYAGLDEYAGVNLIMPVMMVIGGIGFMFGSGGSALVGKFLGEKKRDEASKVFTMIIESVVIVGIIISVAFMFFVSPIANALGSITNGTTPRMVEEAIKYGKILALSQVLFMLQCVFHTFFMINEKQRLAFLYTVYSGVTNVIVDFVVIVLLKWGVVGAAIGTIAGYLVGSILPLVYFIKHKEGNIYLVKTKIKIKYMLQSCWNGSSEFVNNISSSIVGIVFNIQLLKYYGQNGVSAYGTLMYVSFIFVATYIGYAIGVSPIISYNYGANNKKELNNILVKSIVINSILAFIMFMAGELLGPLFSKLYVGSDQELFELTKVAFKIFSINFLFCGLCIFFSSFFTALNNGVISALISFLRTLVFQLTLVFVLPLVFGDIGIWWSVSISNLLCLVFAIVFLIIYNKKYGYFKSKKQNISIE